MRDRSIADLHASLSWDLDDFERGTGKIDASFKSLIDRGIELGKRFRTIGRDMTIGLTLPIAGVAGAIAGMSKSTADDLKAMGNSAKLAGEDFENFQRQAHAAKSVGVEYEKLGDIFKDTREKIGDFAASGGGELKDFFENVAPQVGVTAEMFEKLSGKDALQLYYDTLVQANVGQNEMVFYLESIADEATALIPLLAANGREFRRLGEEANVFTPDEVDALMRYREALRDVGLAMQRIVIAAVNSGLVDLLADIAEKVAEWITRLADTNPAVLRFVGGLALAVAAIGPLVAVLTTVAVVLLPLFIARMGPVLAILSALINPIGTVVVLLAKLSGGLSGIIGGATGAVGLLGRLLLVLARLNPITAAVVTVFTLFGRDIVDALGRVWEKAQEALGPALQNLFNAVVRLVGTLQSAFAELANSPLGQFLGRLIDWLGLLVGVLAELAGSVVVAAFELLINLITRLVESVSSMVRIVQLLLQGEWSAAWDLAAKTVSDTIDALAAPFARLFGWIHDALAAVGILEARVTDATSPDGQQATGDAEGWAKAIFGDPKPARTPYTIEKGKSGRSGRSGRSGPTEEELAARREELELEHQMQLAREAGDGARLAILERQRDLAALIADYEDAGLSNADARIKAEQEIAELAEVRRMVRDEELGLDQLRQQLQEARIRGDFEGIRFLEQELFLEEEIADLKRRGLEADIAEQIATEKLLKLEEARADAIAQRLRQEEQAREIEIARLRGDDPERIRQLQERQRYDQRVEDLMANQDLSRTEAEEEAMIEASDRARAHLQGNFRDAFRGGLQAALDGNLKDFFKRWMEDASFNALARVLDRLADRLADLVFDSGGGGGGGLGGIFGAIGSLFGGGGTKAKAPSAQQLAKGLPKLNVGGSGVFGGLAGVDRNILSMNGQPFAKVSRGEVFDVRPNEPGAGAGRRGELLVRLEKDGGLTAHMRGIAGEVVDAKAPGIGAATQAATLSRISQMQDDRLE